MQESFNNFKTPAKKILWLENGEIFGGAEMFSLDMFLHLSENFSEPVEILYCSNSLHPKLKEEIQKIQKTLPKYISLKTQKIFLPQLRNFSLQNIWKSLVSAKKLRQKITSENFEYVHANTVRTGFILSIAGLSLDVQKSFFSHDYTAPKKWLQFGLKHFQKIFSCSYPIKEHIHQSGAEYKKIHVIENGINPEKFQKNSNTPLRKFGILGRITKWKGQLTVLKAIENLLEEYGREKFGHLEFHFFGEQSDKKEDQEFFLRLKHFVSENSLEKNVIFHGFTPLLEALKKIDAVIHASQEPEPFGRTPLEGAISGKLVFISNIGTPAQIFEDKKNALFFEPKDPEDLSEKIRYAVNPENLSEISEISKNGYKMVSENFNLQKISQKFWKHFL